MIVVSGPDSLFFLIITKYVQEKGRKDLGINPEHGGAILARGTEPANSTLTLTNCILRNNTAKGDGGAIDTSGTTVIAVGSNFTDNVSGEYGGVAYIEGDSRFENCRFERNLADSYGGAFTVYDSHSFDNCYFGDNIANVAGLEGRSGGVGGSIYAYSTTSLNVTNSTFSKNSAFNGGAVYLDEGQQNEIKGCKFEGNFANETGGAIYAESAETTVTGGSMFDCNTAGSRGGAIVQNNGNLDVFGAKFTGNKANGGGAIALIDDTFCSINSCLFDQNEATVVGGGAISSEERGDTATIAINNTVFQNNTSPGQGDDIYDLFEEGVSLPFQCGAGYDNCFCDAGPGPNITTNERPTVCADAGTGSTCSGCTPTPPVSCQE